MQLSADREPSQGEGGVRYERHRPEGTFLYKFPYKLVGEFYPAFEAQWAAGGKVLPDTVRWAFGDYLQCSRLEHGFLRLRCESCHTERLVAFSYKRRGFCPSYGARRVAKSAALLVGDVFPSQPVR